MNILLLSCFFVVSLPHFVSLSNRSRHLKLTKQFDFPPTRYFEEIFPVNPRATIPCYAKNCDNEYGCFDPAVFVYNELTLPPISGCPEVQRKYLLRFFAITKEKPTIFQTVNAIPPNSSVGIFIPGVFEEYDEVHCIYILYAFLRHYDVAIIMDNSYLGNPYLFDNLPIPIIDGALGAVNGPLEARIVCRLINVLRKRGQIDISKMKIAGFSTGAQAVGFIGRYCQKKYDILIPHLVGLDTTGYPLRYSNYALLGPNDGKYVDVIFTTNAFYGYGSEDIEVALDLKTGAEEAIGLCTYIANPDVIDVEQPPCPPQLLACSHFFVNLLFAAAESGKCKFRYFPCPSRLGSTPPDTGFTQFNCKDNPRLFRTCIKTSPFPYAYC